MQIRDMRRATSVLFQWENHQLLQHVDFSGTLVVKFYPLKQRYPHAIESASRLLL
ncbi:hypothetical protein FBUS_10820 [Fasciolopsis buskii]|uniref:Uncharacterized protein n=1 Tax=Fasciolopsis buskii TaxID=27845 RepID=A0A8E0S8S0_9TREM|nr:hypothetical protein FBUS_10820 [Fasciolopsis buski]